MIILNNFIKLTVHVLDSCYPEEIREMGKK